MAKMNFNNLRWILLGVVVIMFFSMQTAIPKQTVAEVEGEDCTTENVDTDCPCWGEMEGVTDAFGIGQGRCIEGECEMTFCFDLQRVGDWLEEKPLNWVTDPANTMMVIAIVALLLMVIFWPKI